MTKKSIELSDLPPEILQLLVENCDLVTRCRLRASSFLLYQIVNSTKLYIPHVRVQLQEKEEVKIFLKADMEDVRCLVFEKNQTGGTRMLSIFREEVLIENSDYMDEAIDYFRQICLQKNVTIGRLDIDTNFQENPKRFTEKLVGVLEKSEIPLKVKSIDITIDDIDDWMWKIMEYCDKRVLKGIFVMPVCDDAFVELFGKQDETLKNLEKIEIMCLCNATDEDVLSLNASVISLNSENFTVDFVYKIIEKFTNSREEGSSFQIVNTKKQNWDLVIPPGFKEDGSTNAHKYYRNELINQPTVYLHVYKDGVTLDIGDTAITEFWGEDESDNDTSDDSSSGSENDSDANE